MEDKQIPKVTFTKGLSKEEFFGKLFQIRDEIHLAHLNTNSYAAHVALSEFYDGILDLTDAIIESTQGKYGILKITSKESKLQDPIKLLEDLAKLTDCGPAYKLFEETWIQNQIDEISTLTYKTLYKLKTLK